MPLVLHEQDPALFEAAVRWTSGETGFPPRLIEKDYFCSVLLERLAATCESIVFKGGTCLAKVHTGFHRLSEDLDFSIPVARDVKRGDRSRLIDPLRRILAEIPTDLPGFRQIEALRGANQSTQYNATLGYPSRMDPGTAIIKVEIGLREPLSDGAFQGAAGTLLLNPLNRQVMIAPFTVQCLTYLEAMAEKLRAALSRREAAIRDFFDVDHVVRNAGFDLSAPSMLKLVRQKLAVPGTCPVNVSRERLQVLRAQVEAELRPVLREADFASFDLDRAFAAVSRVAAALGRAP